MATARIAPPRLPNDRHRSPRRLLAAMVAGILCVLPAAHAQDQHFSMLDLDPLLFNPAYSGFFDGQGRYGAVYRNQWASVSVPFQTLTISAEQSVARSVRNRNGLNLGLWVSADRAGSLSYGSTAASLILSYFQALGDGDDLVSIAAEAGAGQVGFSLEHIDLADDYEQLPSTSGYYPTLGAGAAWFHEWSDRLYTKLGLSMRNINQPSVSFLTEGDSRLARKWNIYARAEWRFRPQISLMPVAGFQHQGPFSELVYGTDMRWYIDENAGSYLALSAGIMARQGDAASFNFAVMWRNWTFALSYDANLSRLASASRTLGAFELGIIYLWGKTDKRHKALPCPII